MSTDKPRLIPTGTCWCGCGAETGLGKFFTQGHDKRAESALIALAYEGSVPHFLHAHGYGPQHSVTGDAIAKTDWEECTECSTKPGYRGGPVSMAKHKRRYHPPTTEQ